MIPCRIHTHYSIQRAFCHIDELVNAAKKLGIGALCITDYDTLSGCPDFYQECKQNNIKPILGCYSNGYILLCKNRIGWNNLIKYVNNHNYGNNNHIDFLQNHKDGLICLITEESSYDEYNILLSLFKNNIMIYVLPHTPNDSQIIQWAEENNLPIIHQYPVYYPNKEDQLFQQIILCSHNEITLSEIESIKHQYIELQSNNFYLQNTGENVSDILLDLIEDFDISNPPNIPNEEDANEKLRKLCRVGWVNKGIAQLKQTDPLLYKEYVDRIQQEVSVFEEFGLSGYLLIIHDIVQFARKRCVSVGLRGSASGCLISYLIDISDIDPLFPDPTLPYHKQRCLMFERFINKGRLSKDRISLPDCDLDIPPSFREKIINYLSEKYGHNHIAHILTLNRMDGKGVIKEVFRVLNPSPNSFDIANLITSYMIDTAKVQDELEDLKEDNPKYNIINYCIDNVPKISEFYQEYKYEFDIAIKLANTIKNHGKHAAGIVISKTPIQDTFPSIIDADTNRLIISLVMEDAELCGAVKYDLLGVAALEKMDCIVSMIEQNLLSPEIESQYSEEGD